MKCPHMHLAIVHLRTLLEDLRDVAAQCLAYLDGRELPPMLRDLLGRYLRLRVQDPCRLGLNLFSSDEFGPDRFETLDVVLEMNLNKRSGTRCTPIYLHISHYKKTNKKLIIFH